MHDPDWRSFIQRILCLMKVFSFWSSEPTWKSFVILVRTRCSISFPPVPKRSSTKNQQFVPRIVQLGLLQRDPAFSQMLHLLLIAQAIQLRCQLYRATVWSMFVSTFAHAIDRVRNVPASVSSRGNHAITTQCSVQNVPPA